MSTWRDQLKPATFRGVPFFVDNHETALGRRVHVHEFPQRDKPYAEDLGRRTRTINVVAYVLGPDYMAARDALATALDAAGPGLLVHPYLGEMTCSAAECSLSESTAEGGKASFKIAFVESGENIFTTAAESTSATAVAKADFASAAVQSNFERRHSVQGKPAFVAQASAGIFGKALGGIESAVALVRGAASKVAELQRDIDAQRRELVDLIYSPASAAQALVGNIKALVRGVAETPEDALSLARSLYRFGADLPLIVPATSSRKAQAANQAELVQLVRVAALAEGARAAARVEFDSYEAAAAARDELVDGLTDAMERDGLADEVYDALRGLRSAVVRDIAARGADLARLVAWSPAATLPSLALAQQLYADASREPELLARNRIRHPLFVPGAVPLEVLADG
ncbi:DNA circularization protein [Roseateles sp. DXS20W]|uniref:DNA circularization protein n=1 Tax=Pelomonas lactea TaxID=3299030 RepID=A0ABW7GK11_9BURK